MPALSAIVERRSHSSEALRKGQRLEAENRLLRAEGKPL